MGSSLFDKIWNKHVIREMEPGVFLLHIDRHVLQETSCPQAFSGLDQAGRKTLRPELTYGVIDHIVSTAPGRTGDTFEGGREMVHLMRKNCTAHGIKLLDVGDRWQGIIHVVSPELGIALPGVTLVCGDSHTTTSGGIGAYAWGIGTTEVEHVLATQSLIQRKPKRLRINVTGKMGRGLHAKDLILHIIGKIGVTGGRGYAVEYAGSAITALPIEGRLTICNMSIELGARSGFIAPDETTFQYLAERPLAPKGREWEIALKSWRELHSDDDAEFDREVNIDCSSMAPQITWGTTPEETMNVDGVVPDPAVATTAEARRAMARAQSYMGVMPGESLQELSIDVAFIGSCTNGRLSDLQAAAAVARGRKVAPGVRALVIPGSAQVKHAAEAAGLDRVFKEAGFEWREPGCSMCVAINDDQVGTGQRSISTTNRNFENRQGAAARTHLASPASVAAAAVTGKITDVRKLMN